ncbi:unnamed protein product [Ambrosiozyma monospora]|uniref:Unnamed protein product n=1 Tax=Ambrosiozyma monospora TaxID=43982 RepID=A0ACB5TE08_AMBMO|nr:unnamed protein product [Ambrosiozyma monospora]
MAALTLQQQSELGDTRFRDGRHVFKKSKLFTSQRLTRFNTFENTLKSVHNQTHHLSSMFCSLLKQVKPAQFKTATSSSLRLFSSSSQVLSGHSKWATIKHKKAANDAARSQQTHKMALKITAFAKQGGTDLGTNLQLAYAVDKAKEMSVPKKVIENAIKRGSGELKNDAKMETVIYEGLAPGGVAVVIEAYTDNKNRSIGFVRPCFNKFSLNMTPTLYMFERKGMILLDVKDTTFDDAFEELLELGCEDINEVEPEEGETQEGNLIEIISSPTDFGKIAKQLKDEGKYTIKDMQIGYHPIEDMMVEVTDEDTKASLEKFIGMLEDVDDVTQVYTNLKEE